MGLHGQLQVTVNIGTEPPTDVMQNEVHCAIPGHWVGYGICMSGISPAGCAWQR